MIASNLILLMKLLIIIIQFFEKEGPRIMSLEPQDDNRDGVAIRVASERLLQRSHQQRFLIVFSDGEPSAFNYSQDGIIDTYEAVETARKFGIEVLTSSLVKNQLLKILSKPFTISMVNFQFLLRAWNIYQVIYRHY